MKNILAVGALTVALSVTVAFSQVSRIGVGIAATSQFPMGDYGNVAGLGIGSLGSVEVGTYPGLALTARSGYIQHFESNERTVKLIPVMGGAKMSGADGGIYVAGELGAVMTRIDYSGNDILESDVDETNLGWNLGVGSMAGPVDVRFSFNVWDASNMDETASIGLNLGFTVWSL